MSISVNDPLPIFDRINNRLDYDQKTVEIILKYLYKRADIEDKFADLLRSIIPDDYDKKNPFEVLLFREIKKECKQRRLFSQSIREKIADPFKAFQNEGKTQVKNFSKSYSKYYKELTSLSKKVENYQAKLQQNSQKLLEIKEPKKKDSQMLYVQQCAKDLEAAGRNKNRYIETVQEVMPSIQNDFNSIDQKYQNQTKDTALAFNQLKQKLQVNVHRETINAVNFMQSYDVEDRSKRFVSNTFDQQPEATQHENATKPMYVIALYDYQGENPSDLKFERGDRIRLTNMHTSGWWDGELNGKIGLFPKDYVVFENPPVQEIRPIELGECFIATSNYNKVNSGDIDIAVGDILIVNTVNQGICYGINLRTNQEGTFPFIYINK